MSVVSLIIEFIACVLCVFVAVNLVLAIFKYLRLTKKLDLLTADIQKAIARGEFAESDAGFQARLDVFRKLMAKK